MGGRKPEFSLFYVISAQPKYCAVWFCLCGWLQSMFNIVNLTRKINLGQDFISLFPFEEIVVEMFHESSV